MTEAIELNRVAALGLPVTWDVVRVGWEGPGAFPRLLGSREVQAHALREIQSVHDCQLVEVAELCSATEEDVITEALAKLCPKPSEVAKRIWTVVLLERLLKELPDSPVDALCELTDFWSAWDFPADSPHVVQGRGNSMAPSEYYTEEFLRRTLQAHREWLGDEVRQLNQTDQV